MTSSTPSTTTTTPGRHPFDQKVDQVKINKSDINNLIMDYMISEGYPLAAKKFAAEANIQPRVDSESIHERVEIRNSIYAGDIQSAIEKINDLNPQILDLSPSLHFSLLRLQLIELIRTCTSPTPSNPTPSITPALDFATTQLAPRAPTSPEFLEDLERTMALLIFPPDNLAPQLAELVDPALRKQVATRVNEAILHSQGARREARIRTLVRLRAWGEQKARESGKVDLPGGRIGVGLAEEDGEGEDGVEDGDDTRMVGQNGVGMTAGREDGEVQGNGDAMVT